MTIRNFLVVLTIILLIAAASLWYTARDNEQKALQNSTITGE